MIIMLVGAEEIIPGWGKEWEIHRERGRDLHLAVCVSEVTAGKLTAAHEETQALGDYWEV